MKQYLCSIRVSMKFQRHMKNKKVKNLQYLLILKLSDVALILL